MVIIGIDPGKTGAVAVLSTIDGKPFVEEVRDTPTINNDYDPIGMHEMLLRHIDRNVHVFIEKVHAMPGQGVCSMFNFGYGFGLWMMALTACRFPYTLVTPQRWKKELMDGKKEKDDARARVTELFPKAHDLVYRKKDIGRADAILIAEYGRRLLCERER